IYYLYHLLFLLIIHRPPISTLFPYTTLFRSAMHLHRQRDRQWGAGNQRYVHHHRRRWAARGRYPAQRQYTDPQVPVGTAGAPVRSEEHTSELQSRFDLVCRLLLEKKKKKKDR